MKILLRTTVFIVAIALAWSAFATVDHVCIGNLMITGADGNYMVHYVGSSHTSPPPDCHGSTSSVIFDCPDCPQAINPYCVNDCDGYKNVACWAPKAYAVHMTGTCSYYENGNCYHRMPPVYPAENPVWMHKEGVIVVPPRTPKVHVTYDKTHQRLQIDYDYKIAPGFLDLYTDASTTGTSLNGDSACDNISGTCYVAVTPQCSTPHSYNVKITTCNGDASVESGPVVVPGALCPPTPSVAPPYDVTNCKPNDDTSASCPISPDICPAHPVNTGSGDVSVTIPLFNIAQSPTSLSFDLSYHSLAPAFPSAISSPIAEGWTHPFGGSLRLADNIVYPGRLLLLTAHGQRYYFDKATTSLWLPIKPISSGQTIVSSGGEYILHQQDGSEIRYDIATGRWNSTRDRWQNAMTGAYNGSGQLTAVSDPVGRAVTFTYDGSGRLASISSGAGTWYLDYTGVELSGIRNPTSSGSWRTFSYTTDSHGVARLLTAVRDNGGLLLEGHTYDSQDRGTSSFVEGGRDSYTFEYDTPSAGQTRVSLQIDGTTTRTTVFSLLKQNGQYLPTRIDGVCLTCGVTTDSQVFTYDDLDHVTSRTDANGHVTEYDIDAYGNMSLVREGAGTTNERVTTYNYFQPGWPAFLSYKTEPSVAGGPYKSTQRSWNANETVLTTTEVGNIDATTVEIHTSTASFDSRHRITGTDGPRTDVSDTTTSAYYADNDPNLNLRGRLHTQTDALGHVTTFEDYDVYGTARKITDPNGVVTIRVTDAVGRVTSTTNQAVPGDSTEASDYTSSREFDARDRLVLATSARGVRTRYGYEDGTNRLLDTIVLDFSGLERERKHRELDLSGQLTAERNQLCTTPANPCGTWVTKREETYKYDLNGRLTEVTHGGATVVYKYDSDGLLLSAEDENHTANDPSHSSPNTSYAYDSLHRLTSVTQSLPEATGGSIATSYHYDQHDELTGVVDPNGNSTSYAYDDFGRMASQVSPVTGTTSYVYDPSGNLTSTTDANGATTTRTYDALGRALTAISARDAATESVTWGYDTPGSYAIGRVTSMTDPTGSTAYSYERRGLLKSEQKTFGDATTYTMSYSYDRDGNRETMTYPTTTFMSFVRYFFDYANRPFSVVTPGAYWFVTSTTYAPFGPMTSMVYGNGATKTMEYDSRYRITRNKLTAPDGTTTLASYAYASDDVGNITQIHDEVNPQYNRDFGYDAINRLVTANTGTSLWQTGSYSYDAMGNMLQRTLGKPPVDDGQILSRRHAATSLAVTGEVDRLFFNYQGTTPKLANVRSTNLPPDDGTILSVPGKHGAATMATNELMHSVQYDAAGNETQYFVQRQYSPRNLLSRVVDNSGEEQSHWLDYAYDGRGLRVTRTESTSGSGASTRHYMYNPELQLLEITVPDQPNVWSSRRATTMTAGLEIDHAFVWFNGQPVGEYGPNRTADAGVLASGHTTRPLAAEDIFYTFTDHLGTPLLQLTRTGQVAWQAEYEPYGNVYTMRTGARSDQPLRLPGQDVAMTWEGAEENYNVFRWYRAGWGRYTQADPYELNGGLNLFAYAEDNPARYSDRLGLDTAGCDLPSWSGKKSPCELACCAAHDQCYDIYHCSSGSWPGAPAQCGCDQSTLCGQCNATVKSCFAHCQLNPNKTNGQPLYYCAAQHRFIHIPGDFPNLNAAQLACQHDAAKDCKIPMLLVKHKQPWYHRIWHGNVY